MKHKFELLRKYKKQIGKLTILIFGISTWTVAIINYSYISDYHGAVSIRYKEPILREQEIDHIVEEMISKENLNIPEVTLWQREEDIIISNQVTNSSVSIGLITVSGNMTKVYPKSMLYGGYLSKGDATGCVIDLHTAYQLFHSENAVGLTISLNHREYTVRGIMQGMGSNTVIVQSEKQRATQGEEIRYRCMELVFSDTENAKRLAENFIQSYGLGTPIASIDGYLYQKLSYLLIHIPLWLGAMLIVIYFARKVKQLKPSRVLFVSGWLGIILISVILIRITKVQFSFSSAMLPTRWSDFGFWGDQWKKLMTSFGGKEGSILIYKDIILKKRMLFVLSGVILAVLSQGVGYRASESLLKHGKP